MNESETFRPHPLFRGGHLQTLAGFYLPTKQPPYNATQTLLELSDGDKIALHDDCPESWQPNDQVALLLHGLAGCHGSGYLVRLVSRLNQRGVRTFRMDMRGSGASSGNAKLPGHAGRTDDAAAAIQFIAEQCPDAPLTMVGFSMGGNIALGTAANAASTSIGNLTRCIAIGPPVDLSKCCRELRTGVRRGYDKYLVGYLIRTWQQNGGDVSSDPRTIWEFDDRITAPLSGFRDAEDYYANCSSSPRLKEITLPTKILAAKDDPVVAYQAIANAELSSAVELITTASGGHLGYVSRNTEPAKGRWMDWQLCEWVTNDW